MFKSPEVCDVAWNEDLFNPIVKLRHAKIFGLFTHHKYYPKFFHVRAKFKAIKFLINWDKNQIYEFFWAELILYIDDRSDSASVECTLQTFFAPKLLMLSYMSKNHFWSFMTFIDPYEVHVQILVKT